MSKLLCYAAVSMISTSVSITILGVLIATSHGRRERQRWGRIIVMSG